MKAKIVRKKLTTRIKGFDASDFSTKLSTGFHRPGSLNNHK